MKENPQHIDSLPSPHEASVTPPDGALTRLRKGFRQRLALPVLVALTGVAAEGCYNDILSIKLPTTPDLPQASPPLTSDIAFEVGSPTVTEGHKTANVRLRELGTKDGTHYSRFRVKTIEGSAKAGDDYLSVDTVVNDTSDGSFGWIIYLQISLVDDSKTEEDEEFIIQITDVSGDTLLGEGTVTIEDNDHPLGFAN